MAFRNLNFIIGELLDSESLQELQNNLSALAKGELNSPIITAEIEPADIHKTGVSSAEMKRLSDNGDSEILNLGNTSSNIKNVTDKEFSRLQDVGDNHIFTSSDISSAVTNISGSEFDELAKTNGGEILTSADIDPTVKEVTSSEFFRLTEVNTAHIYTTTDISSEVVNVTSSDFNTLRNTTKNITNTTSAEVNQLNKTEGNAIGHTGNTGPIYTGFVQVRSKEIFNGPPFWGVTNISTGAWRIQHGLGLADRDSLIPSFTGRLGGFVNMVTDLSSTDANNHTVLTRDQNASLTNDEDFYFMFINMEE